MGCKYCGKEIEPLGSSRDSEFCTPSHRQLYRERLDQTLGQADIVELCPAGTVSDAPSGSRAKLLAFQSAGRPSAPAPALAIERGGMPPCENAGPARLLALAPVECAQGIDRDPEEADFIPLDYHCVRAPAVPATALEWSWRSPAYALPPIGLQPVGESLEGLTAAKDPATNFFPSAPPESKKISRDGRLIEIAAAGIVLVMLGGFGMRFTSRIGTETPAVKRDAAVAMNMGKSRGPLESIRHAIASRAAVELSDTFQKGMEAWGHGASWAPGWNHNPDGYVETGQLALFQPSMKFTDYHLEFFGQIESKSMGWVVRAHDPKNYYAMKFTIIQPGLRPIIALVHYPVIDGHAGRPVQTPLPEVMVHNDTPYHVSVAVQGNRIITAFEGQEVDRWIEDRTISSGGVGFYSDAGERSRLYWMMISKNNDFLGKVCAYLSGPSAAPQALASLLPIGWNDGIPNGYAFANSY